MSVSRRDFLKLGALGAGATAAGLALPLGQTASTSDWRSSLPSSRMPKPYATPLAMAPRMPYRDISDADGPYRLYTVTQRPGSLNIIKDLPTPAYGYGWNGNFSAPGPVISMDQGTRVKLRMINQLPNAHEQWGYPLATSTHLHGSASLPQYDGYADDVTAPGYYKDYEYPNFQPARTLWYHDHGVHHTGQSVYSGMVAQYHMHDATERALLPQGDYDVPLTISDALFDKAGRLVYSDNDHSGLWGDVVLVNGTPWPVMTVQRRVYRFRILMATLSRSMTLKLINTKTGQPVPVHVVCTDGGLMPESQEVYSWRHAGAERYEILVDFGKFPDGTALELRNTSAKNNRDYLHTGKVMRFAVNGPATDVRNNTIPKTLAGWGSGAMSLKAEAATKVRKLDLKHDDITNEFQINGKSWQDVQDSDYRLLADGANPAVGATEIWEIENKSGGWFHPLHIHLVDFQIISRRGGSGKVHPWEKGPKDVVYVGEGEIVRVLTKYDVSLGAGGTGGRYMIHCHNLPHEDNDMMAQFQVGEHTAANDPINAAKPQELPSGGGFSEDALPLKKELWSTQAGKWTEVDA